MGGPERQQLGWEAAAAEEEAEEAELKRQQVGRRGSDLIKEQQLQRKELRRQG